MKLSMILMSIITFVLIANLQAVENQSNINTNMHVYKSIASMSLAFTENQGQWDEKVKFRANAGGATMWFTSDGAYYQFTRRFSTSSVIASDQRERGDLISGRHTELACGEPSSALLSGRQTSPSAPDEMFQPDSIETMMIKAHFMGSYPNPKMVGLNLMEYKCNYFIGNDKSKWQTDVPNYNAVLYKQVYDGIDLKYYGNGKQMEYDFIVSPGADFSQIKIQYEGIESISVNTKGELVVKTIWGEVIEQRPIIYQEEKGIRIPVAGEYKLKGDNSFGFELGSSYDPSLLTVIDPLLSYSTYLGGSVYDDGRGITVDGSGNIYVTGKTNSADFPIKGQYQTDQVQDDVYVTKLNREGEELLFSTYLGGGVWEGGQSIAVDDLSNVYITGYTNSFDFPIEGGYQANLHGGQDAFVTKLNSSGNGLVYSTYLGGSLNDYASSIALNDSGYAFITGQTSSTDFPIVREYQTDQEIEDAFVTKLNITGDTLVYSTYLGGKNSDRGMAIAVDDSGYAYITGVTRSTDYPIEGEYQTNQDTTDAFVTKLNISGDSLVYSTYLGGNHLDFGRGIAVDGFGNAYITGYTYSTDFPIEGAYQTDQGSHDAFVTKLNFTGDSLVYSTYLGGTSGDKGYGIAVDRLGNANITGHTNSTDFPIEGEYQTDQVSSDVFVTKFNSTGDTLVHSTYMGGSLVDQGFSIALDRLGNAHITGYTTSTDFPTVGAYQTDQGSYDAFVCKFVSSDNDHDSITVDFDCDDTNPDIYPGAPEIPDNNDNNCNGIIDEGTVAFDDDGDGYCEGWNHDSNPETPLICTDGYVFGDCDDTNPLIYPGAPETLDDGIDQNCDGVDTSCCNGIRGNFDGDELDVIDIGDLVYMVEFQFGDPSGPEPPCLKEGDIAPILAPDGSIDIGDLVAMVEFQFEFGPAPVDCL